MRRLAALIWVAVLCGCQTSPPPVNFGPAAERGVPIPLSALQVSQIQAGVRAAMKDPMSAMFTGQTLGAMGSNGDITACGLVNAKNSYGGYTGDTPYIATVRAGTVIDAASGVEREEASIIVGMCRDRGVPI